MILSYRHSAFRALLLALATFLAGQVHAAGNALIAGNVILAGNTLIAGNALIAGNVILAGQAGAMKAPPVLEAAGPDTLNLWVMDNGLGSQKAVKKLAKKFHRNGGPYVKVRVLGWANAYATISAALENPDSTVDFPDVLQLGSTWVPHFASMGKLRLLDSLETQVDSSRFYPVAFRASHIGSGRGVYSFPWFLDVRALFANEWLWHSLDIQDSDVVSYSRFLGALRAINRGELKNSELKRVAAFALPGQNDWTGHQVMAPFIWGFGGDYLNCKQDPCRSGLMDQETLEGIALYAKLLGDPELTPNSLQENSAQNAVRFINSELLIHYGTSELIRQLEYPEDAGGLKNSAIADDGIMLLSMPSSSFRSTFVGGSHIALPADGDSTHFAEAERLAAFLLRTDNMDAFCRTVGFLPSDRGLISIWKQDRRYQQIVSTLENGRSFPNIPEWGKIEEILIKFSNGMGEILAETPDREMRSDRLASLLVETHDKVNAVLGIPGAGDREKLRDMARKAFSTDIQEISPENLQFEPRPPAYPTWRILVIAGGVLCAALLALLGRIIYRIVRHYTGQKD